MITAKNKNFKILSWERGRGAPELQNISLQRLIHFQGGKSEV
jgi:hypothetical protein